MVTRQQILSLYVFPAIGRRFRIHVYNSWRKSIPGKKEMERYDSTWEEHFALLA